MDGRNGCQSIQAQLQVVVAADQIVHDAHIVPTSRKVQGSGPAAVAITAYDVEACRRVDLERIPNYLMGQVEEGEAFAFSQLGQLSYQRS